MVIEREAVRAILVTKAEEVLLLRICAPHNGECFWITPGGGLEVGETVEEGLKRELREELGLAEFQIGALVWRRQHTFNWGDKRICQRERYHIVHIDHFSPYMSDAVEARVLQEFRWWPISELVNTRERLIPLSLGQIIARYLAHGPPAEPPELEVLVD